MTKTKKLWKRNAVVAVIVLFICVAAYLNWSYDQGQAATETTAGESETRTLGEAALVSSTEGETISAIDTEDSYFSTARLNREQARDSALEILQNTLEDTAADQTARDTAADAITAMANATLTESEIEGLVTAKGYADCVAYLGEESVSVVVDGGETGLTETDVAIVTDIVMDETGFAANQIKVIDTE